MKLFKALTVRLLFVFILFLSSFAGTALPSLDTRPIARTSTINILRRLGGHPCPNDSIFTCVTVNVPLDHFNAQDTRTIAVTFAVHAARANGRRGMFVVATGGPGTAGISLADSYSSAYNASIINRFDIVFFDQRGVGLSGGLTCPQAAVSYYQSDIRTDPPEHNMAFADQARIFAENCVSAVSNAAILPYLGTNQAVEDLEYFRTLMQDNKFWLYGESYGTQYAQTYAAKYGSHLAGLILDGTVDLTLDGFGFYAQQARAFNDVLTTTLQACNDDPSCFEEVGGNILHIEPEKVISDTVAGAYDHVVEILKGHPVTYNFPLPGGGFVEREFTLTDLESVASSQMYTEADRMMFNRALASSASYQSVTPLARLLYLDLGVDSQTLNVIPDASYSDAEFYAVECQDYGYPGNNPKEKVANYFAAADQVVPSIPRLGSVFYGDMPCMFWPNATTNLTRPAALRASGIPTLVLNATADPATPLSGAVSVFQRLQNGYLITQQGGPHVIFGWGNPCPDNLVTNFLVRGRMPARRITRCPGVTVDDYVPISPTDASGFVNLLDALGWTETEIDYLPEYYYWDGYTPTDVGCPLGGTLSFEATDVNNAFTLNGCSFASDFVITGTGSYNADTDKFILTISTEGRWQCNITYTRTGAGTRIAGNCNGTSVRMQGNMLSPVLHSPSTALWVPGKGK